MPPETQEAHVQLEGVRLAFGNRLIFRGLDCWFPRGRLSCVLGGSGSGKSTMLRLIGGLIVPEAGRVIVDGQDVPRLTERQLFDLRKKIGMMFQGGALLDSITVFDNVAFPLREHLRLSHDALAARVREVLAAVGLRDVEELLPNQLSGGMMRRVALARALVMRPVICLCDEPFSGLDPISVRLIENLFQRINRESGLTMIIVSHDVWSTRRIADHAVVLMPGGEVAQGSPDTLRQHADARVRAFMDDEVDPAVVAAAAHAVEGPAPA